MTRDERRALVREAVLVALGALAVLGGGWTFIVLTACCLGGVA